MTRGKRKSGGGFAQVLQRELKRLVIAAIIGIIALVGAIFRDELRTVIEERVFYGTVEIVTDDENLRKHGEVTILDGSQAPVRSFLLSTQLSTRLSPGDYTVQVFYPSTDASKETVFEEPFELGRRGYHQIFPVLKLPNTISVNLGISKETFVPEEQISFTINSDKDGYVWLFSPNSSGNPNQFFPNRSYVNNRIQAGERYVVPPYQEDSFTLKTRSTPGEEMIVCIITQSNDQQFALFGLKTVVPHVSLKITVTREALWGYDKKTLRIE